MKWFKYIEVCEGEESEVEDSSPFCFDMGLDLRYYSLGGKV